MAKNSATKQRLPILVGYRFHELGKETRQRDSLRTNQSRHGLHIKFLLQVAAAMCTAQKTPTRRRMHSRAFSMRYPARRLRRKQRSCQADIGRPVLLVACNCLRERGRRCGRPPRFRPRKVVLGGTEWAAQGGNSATRASECRDGR